MPPQAGMPPPPVQAPMYGGASLPPGGLGPRPMVQQHRRGISDISGGPPDMGDAKRQQLYGGVAPSPHMQHLTATNGMPHLMQPQPQPGHAMPRPR
jgi:osomolarity two-component system response regulator SKN7